MQPVGVRGGMMPGWPRATGSGPSVILPVSIVSAPAPSTEIEKRSMLARRRAELRAVGLDAETVVARAVAGTLQPEVLHARVRLAAQVRAALVQRPDVEGRAVTGGVLAGEEPLLGRVDEDDERASVRRSRPGSPRSIGSAELAVLTSSSVPIGSLPPKPLARFGQMNPIVPALISRSQSATRLPASGG